MRTVGAWLVAGPIAAVLLLSGCGGSPEPSPVANPTKGASPSASPSASPRAPALPAAAKEKTRAGAIAFARSFMDALNYAGATGDTRLLRSAYIKLCTRCEAISDSIDETYAGGGKIEGGEWHVKRLKFYAIKNEVAFVDAFVDYDAQTWTKKRGAKPVTFPASQGNLKAFNLRWTGAKGWRASALDPKA